MFEEIWKRIPEESLTQSTRKFQMGIEKGMKGKKGKFSGAGMPGGSTLSLWAQRSTDKSQKQIAKAKGRSGKGGNELYLINSRANWHSLDGNVNCPTDIHPLVIPLIPSSPLNEAVFSKITGNTRISRFPPFLFLHVTPPLTGPAELFTAWKSYTALHSCFLLLCLVKSQSSLQRTVPALLAAACYLSVCTWQFLNIHIRSLSDPCLCLQVPFTLGASRAALGAASRENTGQAAPQNKALLPRNAFRGYCRARSVPAASL